MISSPMSANQLISWGQYMHWADLQFKHFRSIESSSTEAEAIGYAAHWLAAEFIVLEGWNKLSLQSKRISMLLSRYPEHSDLLRRCRNAVYHFQDRPLDPRLSNFIKDEHEELRWTTALHFEFQGFLVRFVSALGHKAGNCEVAIESATRGIGWFPTHPLADQINEAYAMSTDIAIRTAGDNSDAATDLKRCAEAALEMVRGLDMYPLSSALSRMNPELG